MRLDLQLPKGFQQAVPNAAPVAPVIATTKRMGFSSQPAVSNSSFVAAQLIWRTSNLKTFPFNAAVRGGRTALASRAVDIWTPPTRRPTNRGGNFAEIP